nr:DUF1850 domain-containing protein [Szabonella alba]
MAALAPLLLLICLGTAARACSLPDLRLERVADGVPLWQGGADGFALRWRHSVTLTPVIATYAIGPDGAIRQTEERFEAHGPGMAHDGAGWRQEGDQIVLPLDRPIPRLVFRTAPEHENRLFAQGTEIDLTLWPGQPLELRALPCKDDP